MVDVEKYCIRCGYLLRGLPMSGKCPECGTAVELSLQEATLAGCAPEYIRTTLSGLSLILNAILLSIILMVVAFGAMMAGVPGAESATNLAAVGVSLMSLLGYWRFSEPDPSAVAFESTDSARKVLRCAVVASLALTTLTVVMEFTSITGAGAAGPAMTGVSGLLTLCGWVAQAVIFFATMRYTRWMASRVPDTFIVKRTKRYMWLLPVLTTVGALVLIGPLVALIMYWNLLNRLRQHLKSIRATGQRAPLPNLNVPLTRAR